MLERVVRRLGAAARELRPRARERLFSQGDPARGMFLMLEGRARLVRHSADGGEVVMHLVTPGESFAEPSLFADVYHCDCVVSVDSRVMLLPRRAMRQLLENDPALAGEFMAGLAGQVRALRAAIELRNIRGAQTRLLAALRLHARKEDGEVLLPDSLKVLAAQLGMAHETLYRALARLEKAGAIRRAEGKLRLTGGR